MDLVRKDKKGRRGVMGNGKVRQERQKGSEGKW